MIRAATNSRSATEMVKRLRELQRTIEDARHCLGETDDLLDEICKTEGRVGFTANARDLRSIEDAARLLGPVLQPRVHDHRSDDLGAAIAEICRQWMAERTGW
jgi:hypothetical protein